MFQVLDRLKAIGIVKVWLKLCILAGPHPPIHIIRILSRLFVKIKRKPLFWQAH